MVETINFCPKSENEIKLTKSLAAPLVESARRDDEARLALENIGYAIQPVSRR
jgi:hypothetical protein